MVVNLFGGENSEAQNALMQALQDCAKDEDMDVYEFIDKTPKTTLIVFLTDKLRENGFNIFKI